MFVIDVISWTSVNGLVVVMVGARIRVALGTLAVRDTVLASRQRPNHPNSIHDVVSAGVAFVGVTVGDNVVVSRQPPNHPYFTHDVVGNSIDKVELEEVLELEVVVSSRHPKTISCSFQRKQSYNTYPTIQVSGTLKFLWELRWMSCCLTKLSCQTHCS